MKTIIFLIINFILASNVVKAQQDTITLINGDVIIGNTISNDNELVNINVKKMFRHKIINIDIEDIYTISFSGKDSIYYSQDSSNGNYFTIEQMGNCIKGIKDANKNYKPKFAAIGGFLSGLTGGSFGFWGICIPTTYVLTSGLKAPKISKNAIIDTLDYNIYIADSKPIYGKEYFPKKTKSTTTENQKFNNKYYKYGYISKSKDKKVKASIKGSIAGFTIFVIASYTIL